MSHSLPPNPVSRAFDRSPHRRERDDYPPPPRDYPLPPRDYPPASRGDRADRAERDFYPPPRERDYPPPPRGTASRREVDPMEADIQRWERRLDRERGPPGGSGDWDERDRDRDREWEWERDRERRDRRPPPHWEEDFDRPKRRRSPSPAGYPSHRRRFSPPPPPLGGGGGSGGPDPATIPHVLSFKQFAEWFRASHPQTARADEEELRRVRAAIDEGGEAAEGVGKERVGMGKRYERYRREYTSRQLYSLYLLHRGSPWFQERYSQSAEQVALRVRLNRQGRVPTVEKYLEGLRAGEYDNVTYELSEEHGKKPSARRMSELDEPEGLDKALGESDEPSRVEVPPKAQQVFIKTVPPTVSRKELEAVFQAVDGFQYLALTEPSVKKSFHRVGWAQFNDDADMEEIISKVNGAKIDSFTLHMGLNTAATVGRIRLTPSAANSLARLTLDGEKARELAIKLEDELMAGAEDEEEHAQGEGEGGEADSGVAEGGAKGAEAPKEENGSQPAGDVGEGKHKGKDEGKAAMPSGLRERGSAVVVEVIGRVLDSLGLEKDELSEEQRIQRARITLDHWISYLRNGLSTCYYCVAPMSFPEELQRKCISHLRPALVPLRAGEGKLGSVPEAQGTAVGGDEEGGDEGEKDDAGIPASEDRAKVDAAEAEEGDAEAVDGAGEDDGTREGGNDEDTDRRDNDEPTSAGDGKDDRDRHPGDVRERDRDRDGHARSRTNPVGATSSSGHLGQKTSEEKWEEGLDHKLVLVLTEVAGADVLEYGGKDVEEETKKLTAPVIKQEEASKYRCKECNKLFRAPEFVIKHIAVKHGEIIQPKLDEIAVFNAFVLDPQHLQPSVTTPAAIDDALPQPSVPMMNPAFIPHGAGAMNGVGGGGGGAGGGGGGGGGNAQQQQMMMMMMQMQQAMMMQMQGQGGGGGGGGMGMGMMGQEGLGLAGRMGGFAGGGGGGGRGGGRGGGAQGMGVAAEPLPPPPPGGEDPRAKRGRVSYMDLDEPGGEGDGGLPY